MADILVVRQLALADMKTKGSDSVAARYLGLMRRVTKNVPPEADVDDMVRFIAGSVPNGFWIFGGFLRGEFEPEAVPGLLVSVASVHIIPHAWTKVAWIEDVATFAEHEGRGYSTQVIETAEKFIAEKFGGQSLYWQRVSREMLTCGAHNREFYEHRGFSVRNECVMQKPVVRAVSDP